MTKCSEAGCSRDGIKRGLCGKHYRYFWRHGQLPDTEPVPRQNKKLRFLEVALTSNTNECVRWPFALQVEGYGFLSIEGKVKGAHRAMCELAHGPPYADKLDAAHSCGNRACINPRHLRWATRRENSDDCRLHGTVPVGNNSKLSPEDVRQIYSDTRSDAVIAKEFGCSTAAIFYIQSGRTWRSVTGAQRS